MRILPDRRWMLRATMSNVCARFARLTISTAQLLKMAMWVQSKEPASHPKLFSVYQREESITMLAITGSSAFPNPPFTFTEVATEALT